MVGPEPREATGIKRLTIAANITQRITDVNKKERAYRPLRAPGSRGVVWRNSLSLTAAVWFRED
jgi:hypothetical protein